LMATRPGKRRSADAHERLQVYSFQSTFSLIVQMCLFIYTGVFNQVLGAGTAGGGQSGRRRLLGKGYSAGTSSHIQMYSFSLHIQTCLCICTGVFLSGAGAAGPYGWGTMWILVGIQNAPSRGHRRPQTAAWSHRKCARRGQEMGNVLWTRRSHRKIQEGVPHGGSLSRSPEGSEPERAVSRGRRRGAYRDSASWAALTVDPTGPLEASQAVVKMRIDLEAMGSRWQTPRSDQNCFEVEVGVQVSHECAIAPSHTLCLFWQAKFKLQAIGNFSNVTGKLKEL
jgi:hypothetical protein